MLCKLKPYYDELNKVAIGYKKPLCLTRAKQAQPALYNGHEIIKTNHVPAIVHNSEDTLEIAEITRKKMNDKMKNPECVQKKVKITPPDYSKENYLATFTPHKQLTPEQIFWSQDLIKMKVETLKTQATASRPIKALMVYPPNTPATLVPRVLPTKSQVKINIFALIQLFSDFEKTCNKRITPTGLTEGERGFEQTKACYLTEVIPFFKTLKEHFEGIQKALTKEIKEMKDIFEELEAEVDQNGVDRKHDEIEWKNLLIANDNLIADCLSKEVFYVATNSELNVSRMRTMHHLVEAVATACYTKNRSLIYTHHCKTPYELVHDKKPDLTFFRVFGALYYPTNDSEYLGKLQPTADIGIFVGYAPSRKGYRIYNKRTRRLLPNRFFLQHLEDLPRAINEELDDLNPTNGSLNTWNLLVLKDRFLLIPVFKFQSITVQPNLLMSLKQFIISGNRANDHPLDNIIGNPLSPISTKKTTGN
ncbi:integrase, catalytic region, zinc finger, CCHC-type containing protein [Tanacetum coccineum]